MLPDLVLKFGVHGVVALFCVFAVSVCLFLLLDEDDADEIRLPEDNSGDGEQIRKHRFQSGRQGTGGQTGREQRRRSMGRRTCAAFIAGSAGYLDCERN